MLSDIAVSKLTLLPKDIEVPLTVPTTAAPYLELSKSENAIITRQAEES